MEIEINKELLISRLKKFRGGKGLTQAEVAEKIGISPVNYAKYECGTRTPSLPRLVDIALVLEKPIECFLMEERSEMHMSQKQFEHLRSLDADQLSAILEQLQKLYQSQK